MHFNERQHVVVVGRKTFRLVSPAHAAQLYYDFSHVRGGGQASDGVACPQRSTFGCDNLGCFSCAYAGIEPAARRSSPRPSARAHPPFTTPCVRSPHRQTRPSTPARSTSASGRASPMRRWWKRRSTRATCSSSPRGGRTTSCTTRSAAAAAASPSPSRGRRRGRTSARRGPLRPTLPGGGASACARETTTRRGARGGGGGVRGGRMALVARRVHDMTFLHAVSEITISDAKCRGNLSCKLATLHVVDPLCRSSAYAACSWASLCPH